MGKAQMQARDELAKAIRETERLVHRLGKAKRKGWKFMSAYLEAHRRLGELRLASWKYLMREWEVGYGD